MAGFEIIPPVLSAADTGRLLDALSSPDVLHTRAGARHLLAVPAVVELAGDERLRSLAARALGGAAVPFRVTYFDKAPDSNWSVSWHQDTVLPLRRRIDAPAWGPWSVKNGVLCARAPAAALEQVVALRVHLDDSAADNGPLRVLPGTHLLGVLPEERIGELARTRRAFECLVPRGGIVVMRPLLVHSSARIEAEAKPRRVLHVEYASSLTLGAGIELAVT